MKQAFLQDFTSTNEAHIMKKITLLKQIVKIGKLLLIWPKNSFQNWYFNQN